MLLYSGPAELSLRALVRGMSHKLSLGQAGNGVVLHLCCSWIIWEMLCKSRIYLTPVQWGKEMEISHQPGFDLRPWRIHYLLSS